MTKSKKKTNTSSRTGVSEDTKDSMQLENRSAESGASNTKMLQNSKLDHKSRSKSQSSGNRTGDRFSDTEIRKTQEKKVLAESTAKKAASEDSQKTGGENGKADANSNRAPNRFEKKSSFQKSEANNTRVTGKKWSSAFSSDQSGDFPQGREKKILAVIEKFPGI